LPDIRKDTLASPLNLDTRALGEAVPSNDRIAPENRLLWAAKLRPKGPLGLRRTPPPRLFVSPDNPTNHDVAMRVSVTIAQSPRGRMSRLRKFSVGLARISTTRPPESARDRRVHQGDQPGAGRRRSRGRGTTTSS